VFESLEEAHYFYHDYAQVSGFNMHIRTSSTFRRSTEIRYRRYVCSCEGHCSEKKVEVVDEKKERKTLTSRNGCPVAFVVSRKKGTSHWIATHVNNIHNHVLVSPRSAHNLRNQKVMPTIAKNLVEKFSEAGLPTGKVSDLLNGELNMNLSSRDCWNH
jgi:FAR1 DNA-binding domain